MENTPTTSRPRPRPEPRIRRSTNAFDLYSEAKAMKFERAWKEHGHDAKTLIHREHDRAVLIVLQAGKRIPKHDVDGSVTLLGIEGRARIHLPDEIVEIGPGSVVALAENVPYDIEAKAGDVSVLMSYCPCECE